MRRVFSGAFARTFFGAFVAVFSSLATSCILILLLGLLTWLGTLEQTQTGLFEVQRKYFESFVLVHYAGSIPIPLPGANLVLCLLAVNLTVGGLIRIRKSGATAGIIVAHVGILMLIASAFVKHRYSQDGHVTLFEGQQSAQFQSYFRWEIVVNEDLGGGKVRERVIPDEQFVEAYDNPVRVNFPEVPFAVEIERAWRNCRPESADGGVKLVERPADAQAERNIAGAVVSFVDDKNGMRRETLVWGAESKPYTFVAGGKTWAVTLRRETYPMHFSIDLEKFTKEDHPRTDMPSAFSSDVKITTDGSTRDVRISMNEPLREKGLVLYQASWGPANARPGEKLFSTFAVVRNPADQGPLIACIVIAAGLIFHFSRRLLRFVRLEARPA